jgi:allantoinase
MSEFDLVLRGCLVLPDRVLDDGHLAIRDGRIILVGAGEGPAARLAHDLRGQYILPGVIDGQVHSTNQLDHEGIGMASRAAAAGGITSFVDMPYDEPAPVTNAALLADKAALVGRAAHVDVGLYATIAPAEGLAEIAGMVAVGACGFKFSTYEAHPVRFPRIPDDLLYDAFRQLAPIGLLCAVHNQDQEITRHNTARALAAGDTGWDGFGRALPPLVEDLATARVFELGALTGARAHAVHVSTDRGFAQCRMYRQAGHQVSAETCVQYLMLNEEEDVRRLGARVKHYPPIRRKAETESLWQRVAAGECAFVSSDHAAWALVHKQDPVFFRNAAGGPGLETLLPAFWTGCQEHGLGPALVARMLCEGPARAFGFAAKGRLAPGMDADLVVLNPGRFVHDASRSQSAVQWSAFDGRTMTVRVAASYLRGALAWDGSAIVNAAGSGRFLRREGIA